MTREINAFGKDPFFIELSFIAYVAWLKLDEAIYAAVSGTVGSGSIL